MKLKCGYIILLSVILIFLSTIEVNAINTGFSVEELSKEEQDNFVSNIDITLLTEEPAKSAFICFDVNNSGLIAIGQDTPGIATVCVYSMGGFFQYGYSLNCLGHYGVEWDGENLNIYLFRSDKIVSVSPTGVVLGVFEVQNTVENNLYSNNYIHATRRIIGDTEYCITNDLGILNFFASSFSQVVVKASTGVETIVYDAAPRQHTNAIVAIMIVCICVAMAVVVIVGNIKRAKQERID